MFSVLTSNSSKMLAALDKSMAIIEFDLTGKILTANTNFCDLMEYAPSEIIGRQHSIFVDEAEARSPEYAAFWARLGRGEFVCDEFKRIGKNGKEVFIRGNYNPIVDGTGKPTKVVKFCNDITTTKLAQFENSAKMDAIGRSQAVIEFSPDGKILNANANFLSTLGYGLNEVVGQHHSLFVEPAYAQSPEYQAFWSKLRAGEFVACEFKRVGKGGREVFIQASYNPIFDFNGRVVKIVKFAIDMTQRVVAVQRLGSALGALSEGDLGSSIAEPFLPALDPIRQSFNRSVETLKESMAAVRHNAEVIQSGSQQIRVGSDDLAQRTEQQAAAIEEASAALSEMTDSVRLSSSRADEAGELVSRTKLEALQSGQIVTEAVAAMGKIEGSSDRIGNIIGVIDEIAFQTSLLALNAGVEAARAGEAGRGFAVVAQEVRGLAQRSADAAKEIKTLISTSRQQVEEGVNLVGRAGEALKGIVEKVAEIDRLVHAIVASARTQALGFGEINSSLGTLDKGTQQNMVMVEESTAACNELAHEVASLNALLSKFQIDSPAMRHMPPRHATSPVHDLHARVAGAF